MDGQRAAYRQGQEGERGCETKQAWDGMGWDWMGLDGKGREAMEHGGMGCETMEHRVVCCVLMSVMHRLLSVSGSCDEAMEGLERLGMRMLGGQWERGETVRGGEGHMTTTGSGG